MSRPLLLLVVAALSFIPTLFFYTVGEEGSYTISTIEMWHNNNFLVQTLYGMDLNRPPLINWLVMLIAQPLGWTHALIATRAVSILATLGLTAWLYILCNHLFKDKSFSLFAALSCLSLADLLLYRGWLAYSDPAFAFFIFGAIASLWIASAEQRHRWLALSVFLVSCALLTKALTAYIFFGTAVFVLLLQPSLRQFLLSPKSLALFALALIVPFAWFMSLPQVEGHSASMLNEITRKFAAENWISYLVRLFSYPLETAIWLSPTVGVACYFFLRKKTNQQPDSFSHHFRAAAIITALCILPYWLAPQGGIRYLLPIYPMVALVSARIIWRAGESARVLALRWFTGVIAFKFIFVLVLFPYYQNHYRGENYVIAAKEIMTKTAGFPLYVTDVSTNGLNIIGFIDTERYPLPPITTPPANMESGFVLVREFNAKDGVLVKRYPLAADEIFLVCRGKACDSADTPNAKN